MSGDPLTTGPAANHVRHLGKGVRAWVFVAGGATLLLGGWAFFLPEGFFNDFPIRGADWVSTLGEFNEHLMRDYGSAQIGLGIAAIISAARWSRRGVISLMVGYAIFGPLHFGYHLTTFDHFDTGSAMAQGVALVTFVLIPLGVLLALRRDGRA